MDDGVTDSALAVKQSDDPCRQAREIVERFNDIHARQGLGLIERYNKGDLQMGVRYALADEANYGFVIRADIGGRWKGDIIGRKTRSADCEPLGFRPDGEQAPVFPLNVEAMEGVKQLIPSTIRLQRFKEASFALGKPLYEFRSLVSFQGLEFGLAGADGEISLFGFRYVEAVSESRAEQIETASDGVEIGASLDAETERKRLLFHRYYDIVRRWRFCLFDSYAAIRVDPPGDPLLEGWELGYGPVNACLGI